ncbi:MAG: xanthine dehydrogenase family protein subunit M [Candidatus Binatia bacterium]|nr:xanthine dehydrogenase family protein subunit M [Candidatus Binatia bacterium]
MLLVLPEFEISPSSSVQEASSLLAKYGGEAKVVAGGTDLLTLMKHKKLMPRRLINIKGIPDLDRIRYDEGGALRIGALATIQYIKDSSVVIKKFRVLSQTGCLLGTTQIRNLGTLGGNLGNASPAAEFAPALLTLGASVRCVGQNGERTISLDEFFLAPGKNALRQDEILTEVLVPALPPRAEAIYLKHSLRRMDVSIAGAAVFVCFDGDVCREVHIALGSVAPTPFRARKAEETIRGRRLTGERDESNLLDEVARIASDESSPIDDIREYAVYRKKIVRLLVKQGLQQVIARARG